MSCQCTDLYFQSTYTARRVTHAIVWRAARFCTQKVAQAKVTWLMPTVLTAACRTVIISAPSYDTVWSEWQQIWRGCRSPAESSIARMSGHSWKVRCSHTHTHTHTHTHIPLWLTTLLVLYANWCTVWFSPRSRRLTYQHAAWRSAATFAVFAVMEKSTLHGKAKVTQL